MKFKNFIALVLMLSIIVSTNGFSTLSAQKISDENNFYSSILSPKKQVKVGDYYELLNNKQNLLMNTQNDIEESVEANTETGVGANDEINVGANACGALENADSSDENINTDELNNSSEEEATEEVSEEEAAETNEEVVESNEETSAEPIEETTVEEDSETTSESSVETGVGEEQIASESETEEELEITKKNDSLNFGADPHSHKVCGINASVVCTHTLDGITHTENVVYEEISNTTGGESFINFVNSKTSNYYYLNDHLSFGDSMYSYINKDVYICLNGYNFYTGKFFRLENCRVYITNCKTNSNLYLINSSNKISSEINVYGVNKNITFTNQYLSDSPDRFLDIFGGEAIYYYSLNVKMFMNDKTNSDETFIYKYGKDTRSKLYLEDLDIKLNDKDNYKYTLVESENYQNETFSIKMKNNKFNLSNCKMDKYFSYTKKSTFVNWDEKQVLRYNNISFYGQNIFDGYELKSEDGSARDFIKCFDINIIDGETTIKNFKNYTSGKIFHGCNLNVEQDACLNINSNQIKYEQNKDQCFIEISKIQIAGSMIASNNSFVSAGSVDSSNRAFLNHTPPEDNIFTIGSKKIVIENTKIYKSDDDTGEELNDDSYIYDLYLTRNEHHSSGYPYLIYKQNDDVYNKYNNFGKLGFSPDNYGTKSFSIYFISKWNSTYVDIENIDDFDKHFIFGKKKNNDVYIHKISNGLYISLHDNHKICGAREDGGCKHTIIKEHTDIKNYELLDIKLDAEGLKSKIEGGTDVKYLCLRSDIISEDVIDITLKNDVHICLNGHTMKNIAFNTYQTAIDPEIKWDRFNLYIDECLQSNVTGEIYCKKDFFAREVKLHIFCNCFIYGNTNYIRMYIKSLCVFESTTKINNQAVRGLLTEPIDCNIFGVRFYKYDDNTEVSNCWFLNTDKYDSGEYQIINLNIEKTELKMLKVNSIFSRNIYLKNKWVLYQHNEVSGDYFNISSSGEIRFLGSNENTIEGSKSAHSGFLESNVPFIIESGKLTIKSTEVYSDNVKGMISFNAGLQVNNGAVLDVYDNSIRKTKKNQYMLKLSGNSDNIINGELNLRDNKYAYSTEDDDFIHSTLFMEDKAQLKIGGKINVSGTKAYKGKSFYSSYLSTQHICQIYTEMKNYDTPIFELAEGATLNTNCKFAGIHFKYNGGSGHILNNFNYDESTHQNIFVLDKHGNDNLNLYQDGDDLTVRGKLYTIRYNYNNPDGTTFTQVSTSSVPTKMLSNNTTKPDHIFIGWATVSDLIPKSPSDYVDFKENSVQFVREFDVDGQVVDLYGVWFNLNTKFNVSFDMHGHGDKIATLSILYNSLIEEEPKPTAKGYIFDAWYKEAKYEKLWNFEEDKVDNDLILHAKWDPKKYNFTLVLDEGAEYAASYTSPTSRKYDEEFQFPTDANVVKKGYKVYSWHENQDFSDTGFTKIPKYTDTVDNKTYYLKMGPIGYRVTFRSSDSNVIGTKKSIDCIYDNPTTYKAINISEFKKPNWKNQYYRYVETRNISDNSKNDTVKPNRTRLYSEYEFNNLSEVDDVEFIYEPIFTMISNEETDPGKSREEHEEQTKDNETFIITYYMNRDDSDTVTKIETYDYNKIARIKSAQELGFINEGYKLIGFSIDYDKTAKKYDVGEEIFFEADASPESENNINLYALWDVIGYKVTFTADGISGVSAESVTHNLNFIEVKTSPAKDYFKKENENVAYYEFSHSLLYGSEYNYTAKRERIYTNAEFSKLATFEDVELVYKPHYTRESNASTDPELSPEEREEKTKQYETFNITYYANKSAADTENKIEEYRYDTVSKIKSDLFVNPGYHLLGWTDVRTSKNVVYSIDEEIFFKVENDAENDINLYAVWKENTYKVVWTADGLSDVTGSDIERELRFTELCKSPDASHFTKVSKDNYRFAYYEYFKIEPSSSTGYNLLRQRLYSLQDFVKLVDINDVTLYFKPVFTIISNEETNPGHSTDEHSEQTKENETFVFTYMPNGADGNEKVVRYRYDKIAFAEKQIYQRTGYEFLGWDENENAAVATYEPGQELFMMVENDDTNDKTLYAIWLKFEYTVVFSANGQTDVLGTDVRLENIAYDEIKNAPPQNAFTRNSDKFAYYEYVSTTVNGEVSDIKPKRLRLYAEQEFKNLSAKNRAEYLYRAVFTDDGNETDREEKNKKLSFEIHYYANNGTKQKVIQIASYSTPTFIKNNNFKYDKYIFKGYSETKNNKNVKYKNGDEVFVKVEDNRIYNLYAVWEEDPNYFYQPTDSGGGNGGSGGGGGSFSMDPVIGVPGQQYAKYFVQNEDIYVISKNKSTGGDGNNGNKMNGKWYYEVETAKWKYITDPTDRLFNPQIKEYNGFLVDGMYMLGNNKYVYSFDPFGYLETGILYKNGKIYYAETSGNFIGALVKGEEEINGIVYNFNDYTAELTPPADNIYKVASGEARFNPNTNSYHYFVKKDDGQEYMLTNGMYKIKSSDGKYYNYYFDIFGNIITGIVTYNNKQYYMGADGREVNNLEG